MCIRDRYYNQYQPGGQSVCVHAFLEASGAVYQTLPWEMRGWHCGGAANGTHIGGDEQELRTLVTDAVYDRVKVKNHDCEAKDLVYLGTTPHGTPVSIDRTAAEADLVVCLGAVTHHVMAGFGGGRKSILPGISGRETIFHNHAFSLDAAQLRSNPAIGNGVLTVSYTHLTLPTKLEV